MSFTARTLLLAGTAIALSAGQAFAQSTDEPQATNEVEAITVTASRVQRSGFQAPTPTTVISTVDLEKTATTNPADYLNKYVPSFTPTVTPTTSINSTNRVAGNSPDMRGLGARRTLVLVDGRRHVATNPTGTLDIDVIPSAFIQRIDVVTGGASAAWGSDAVAGVVNLVFKDRFEGLEGLVQTGVSGQGDNQTHRVSLAGGMSFLDDRLNVMVGGDWTKTDGVTSQGDRDWASRGCQIVSLASTVPQRQVYCGVNRVATPGGLIVGVTGFPGSPLVGTTFGPGGALGAFTFGTPLYAGAIGAGSVQQGGSGVIGTRDPTLVTPNERANIFSRASFQVTEGITAYAEASYAESEYTSDLISTGDGLINFLYTVRNGNPYIPSGLTLPVGFTTLSVARVDHDFGVVSTVNTNETERYVLGVKGDLAGWRWDAYWQRGENEYRDVIRNNPISYGGVLARNYATDVVSVGGTPTCFINADGNPANDIAGCTPINLFGPQTLTAAQQAFIARDTYSLYKLQEDVWAASVNGEPFSTWAGPVSIAAGVEHRKTRMNLSFDPRTAAGATPGNGTILAAGPYVVQQPGRAFGNAEIEVNEAFVETVVPLARDLAVAKSLDLNAAYRWTDYSFSGQVETWKLGLTWEPTDAFRFRATTSRDIRAPNIVELFTGGPTVPSTLPNLADPFIGGGTHPVTVTTGGNPALVPEMADTTSFGLVYTSQAIPGLRASVDAYRINITGAIGSLAAQNVIDRCFAGETQICGSLVRDPVTGAVTNVNAGNVNLARLFVKGVDFEVDYRREVGPGDLSLRFLANRTLEFIAGNGAELHGSLGQGAPSSGTGGVPRWRWSAFATYDVGPFSGTLVGRWISGGVLDRNLAPNVMARYEIPSVFYADATVSWEVLKRDDGRRLQAFVNVQNLFDKDPPLVPATSFLTPQTNANYYDVVGRMFNVGVRFRY